MLTLNNYIGIYEDANIIYQKTMAIPDNLIIKYFELATDIYPNEIEVLKLELKKQKQTRVMLKCVLQKK